MATFDQLIDKITNIELRHKLKSEIARLQQTKQFGLVFEEHLPDATLLYEVKVRRGQKVTLKDNPLKLRFEVLAVSDGIAECVSLDEPGQKGRFEIGKLLPFADFGDPIYPYLKPIDKISTAPESNLWHEIIEADNYHALQLLAYLYPGKVDCIYIDPPYNTGARDWNYNNDYVDSNDAYRHSKWLSMMKKRLLLAKKLLNPNASVLIVTIDEKECVHLGALLEDLFPNAKIQMVSTVINPKGNRRDNQFSRCEEYIYFIYFGNYTLTPVGRDMLRKTEVIDKPKDVRWRALLRGASNHGRRIDRENLFYPLLFDSRTGAFKGHGPILKINESRFDYCAPEGMVAMWPIGQNGEELTWNLKPDTLMEKNRNHFLSFGKFDGQKRVGYYFSSGMVKNFKEGLYEILGYDDNGAYIIKYKDKSLDIRPLSVWNQTSHSASEGGSTLLSKFICTRNFPFPKSLYAVHDTLRFFIANKPNALIVDFFAGSGTTLHAVNLLNAEDGGNRRCIMVTNNEIGEAEEIRLKAKGKTPIDKEWSDLGIAHYVTWPRTVASITGKDVNGNSISGEYLTYLTQEKECPRKFKKVSYVQDIYQLSLNELKELVSNLTEGGVAKNKVTEDTKFVIDEKCPIAVLLDDRAAIDWLDKLDEVDHINTFVIVTRNNKLFNSLKCQINKLHGPIKTSIQKTIPIAEGFKANVEFFHLGFLDKNAVARNKQFKEILPLLWLKAGGLGECPTITDKILPSYLILQQNKFAVLIQEYAFSLFAEDLKKTTEIDTIYIVTNSTPGYREMIKVLHPQRSFQLYRDYLDNFRINYIQ